MTVGAGVEAGTRAEAGAGKKVGVEVKAGAGVTARAWAELLRLPALFTVPGDALAGAAAAGARPNSRTLLAIGSSLCLYEAGMALNDWADRAEDAVDRPHRPLPSGRVRPAAALAAAGVLTAVGLALAARAGRTSLAVAAPLAATIWAYDLALKQTPAGPAAMATARGLDLLLGATTTTGRATRDAVSAPGPNAPARIAARRALPSAVALATHTLAVTAVSRGETQGGSTAAPLAALATTGALAWGLLGDRGIAGPPGPGPGSVRHPGQPGSAPVGVPLPGQPGSAPVAAPVRHPGQLTPASVAVQHLGRSRPASAAPQLLGHPGPALRAVRPPGQPGPASIAPQHPGRPEPTPGAVRPPGEVALRGALVLAYAVTFARPLFHAVLNPSPPLTQRAVGGGIRAMIPLQAALAARAGAPVTALLTAALAPAARRFARKVSVT
ncbi:SCO3242 family prenyltransferase [Streptomyces sp. NPDC057757]|uniref:SCO3242 family prenyltransferase n=1 Tax=Streptomyces sp. NPDC057757 TaxID=3346241 RepID=UPI0036B1FE8E